MLPHLLPLSKKILSAIHNDPLFIFLDYDGTLSPIVNNPAKAKISASQRKMIKELSKCRDVRVAIVSGRSLTDIKKMVKIQPLIYMGNHGLEYEGPFMKHVHPVASAMKDKIQIISEELTSAFKDFKGVFVENKTFSLSVHYRMLDTHKTIPAREVMYAIVAPYLKSREVMIRQGKKVWEVRPMTDWNKGKMVIWTLGRLAAKFSKRIVPFYFGDDSTDEDAFRILQRKGVTVRVTEHPEESSFADYYLKSPNEVYKILHSIKLMRTDETGFTH